MKKILFILAILFSQFSYSQVAPQLEYVCELYIQLDPALVVGETPHGIRRIIPIVGGNVNGPQIKGEVLKGGADWQVLRKDGNTELEAQYQFRTDDGVLIYIHNVGVRLATPEIAARLGRGEQVDPSQYYFRTLPRFEAPVQSRYAWLNDAIFICKGERLANSVKLRVWKLL
jgi:hypothetical protein